MLKEDMIKFRAEKNMSQTELAKLVGVNVMTINAIENGKQTPRKVTEEKIRRWVGR